MFKKGKCIAKSVEFAYLTTFILLNFYFLFYMKKMNGVGMYGHLVIMFGLIVILVAIAVVNYRITPEEYQQAKHLEKQTTAEKHIFLKTILKKAHLIDYNNEGKIAHDSYRPEKKSKNSTLQHTV